MSSTLLPASEEILKGLAQFEQHYGCDAGPSRAILEADPAAFALFQKLPEIGKYVQDIPLEAWYAANIAAIVNEDCGPCTQLAVKMAEDAGVSADILRAVLSGDTSAMSEDILLAYHFAEAVLSRQPDADTYRQIILKQWGARALVSLSFGIMAARAFPTVRYAMGYGQSCSRVMVQGQIAKLKQR